MCYSDCVTNPAIPPLPVEEWSESARTVLPRYLRRPELYLSGGPDAAPMPQALRLFAHHVELGASWMAFSNLLAGEHATLSPRERELAILRVAWKSGSDYEWKQHVRIGARSGVTTDELYAIPQGSDAESWAPLDRAILEAVDQIADSYRIEPATWSALADHFDHTQMLELLFVIGGYLCFAAVTNSTGLTPDPPTEEVDAPEMPS